MCNGEFDAPAEYLCLPCWDTIDRMNRVKGMLGISFALLFGSLIIMLTEWATGWVDFNGTNVALFGMFWVVALCIIIICDDVVR